MTTPPFEPLFSNPHWQTIASHFWPRPVSRFPLRSELYETEPGVKVLVQSRQPEGAPRGDVVLVHGLEGDGRAGYMRSLSHCALAAGFAAHAFHMRTCGGTERLCSTLYHSGLTSDLHAVLRQFEARGRPPAFLAGFSLGGNVVLKLAGELGSGASRWIRGVCAVSPPIDLAACSARLGRPENRLYELRFVRKMLRRLRATGRYRAEDLAGLRTVFAIDDRITAPSFGFRDAAHYYATQSSNQFLAAIAVPTLLIQAKDDPLVPAASFEHPAIRGNPRITLHLTERGGHLGFISKARPRLWLDEAILAWVTALIGGH